MQAEVGRELKVSDLAPGQIVVLEKPGRPMASVRVIGVTPGWVHFRAQLPNGAVMGFLAQRIGPDGEHIRDEDSGMKLYEYLGEE